MPIDKVTLGLKCRRVRETILDMTLDQASTRTGIDKARLDAIENGALEPSGDEVLIIADVYHEPVEFFITNEPSASIEKASDLYRMYGNTFTSMDRQRIQEFLTLCRMEHEIEGLLGSRPRVFAFNPGRVKAHMRTAGREVAEKLRVDVQLGDGPIEDPFHLARKLGCHVFRRQLDTSSVSGVMLRHDDFGPCILVNYLEGYFRQNFSVAHELCHALLDDDHTVTVSFDRPADEEREELRKREWRANAFAAHLLFPHRVRERLSLGDTGDDHVRAVKHAAESYHVNPVVVLYSLQEAGRLSQQQVRNLKPGLTIPKHEQNAADMAAETTTVQQRLKGLLEMGLAPEYVKTCLRAYREGEISYGKLADALLVSPVDLPSVVSDFDYDMSWGSETL